MTNYPFFRRLSDRFRLWPRTTPDHNLINLIRECTKREVAAEFDRQAKAEAAVWLDYFGEA